MAALCPVSAGAARPPRPPVPVSIGRAPHRRLCRAAPGPAPRRTAAAQRRSGRVVRPCARRAPAAAPEEGREGRRAPGAESGVPPHSPPRARRRHRPPPPAALRGRGSPAPHRTPSPPQLPRPGFHQPEPRSLRLILRYGFRVEQKEFCRVINAGVTF